VQALVHLQQLGGQCFDSVGASFRRSNGENLAKIWRKFGKKY
jgi:hypothetical protein